MTIPCTTCGLWESMEGDLYCSWCGATLVDLKLTLDYDYLYAGDPKTALKLEIMHSGAWGSVKLESVKIDQLWVTIKENHQARTLPNRLLRAGEFVELTLEADLAALSDDYHLANITVMSNVGPRTVTFEAVPRFALDKVSTGGEHTIWLDNLPEEKLTGYLAISSGVVTVESLQTDVNWATVKPIDQTIPCRLDARRKKRLEFHFEIDEPRLMQEIQAKGGHFPAEHGGNVLMKFRNMEDERSWPLYVKCLLPPELNIPEAEKPIEVIAFKGKHTEFGLTLENGKEHAGGHAPLEILKIESDVSWLKSTSPIAYPIVVESGQFRHVSFETDVEKLTLGSHQAKLIFLTNIAGPNKQEERFVELEVRELPRFDGVLAIDFGTTNSCCYFIRARGRQGFIRLGEGEDRDRITSSSILYKNILDSGRKHYEIGNFAYQYSMSGAPLSVRCTVTKVKRLLGTDRRYQIRFQDEPAREEVYTPREVTTDILRRVFEQAEDKLRARVTAVTVTHPSRFSVRQLNDLKAAVIACGIDENAITLVHEPIAAALNYIRRKEVRTKYKEYHVMVFDFGGGTIDITLLKVVNESQPGRPIVHVKPDVLGVTGNPHFGGEDLTEKVLDFLQASCQRDLKSKSPNAIKCLVPIEEEQFGNVLHKKIALNNRPQLRLIAERAKIAISSYRGGRYVGKTIDDRLAFTKQTKLIDKFKLEVIVDNETKEFEFDSKDILPESDVVASVLRPTLADSVEMMKQLAKKNRVVKPEVILLSGMSSAIPIVEEAIHEAFRESDVVKAEDLKACVVEGACLLAEEEPLEGVVIEFEPGKCLSAMTSSLGISVRRENGRRFKTAIEAGEPIGHEGVRGTIERDVEFTRRSRITIYENTGSSDKLIDANDKDNPNITELKTFKLESKLSEWERTHSRQISEPEIANATIELEVTPNLKVKLRARIPGIEEPFEFEEVEYIGG